MNAAPRPPAAAAPDPIRSTLDAVPTHPWSVRDHPPFVHLACAPARLPAQGWKLHITAHASSYPAVVAAVLPVLARRDVEAKVVHRRALDALNDGLLGLTQIGKVITAYPDPAQLHAVARELDDATSGLDGPRLLFDRRLHRRSSVHYRYGAFTEVLVPQALGGLASCISRPDGTVVPDDRTTAIPSYLEDPFPDGVDGAADEPVGPVLAGRYAVLRTVAHRARGTVAAAVDLREMRPVVCKRAYAWATMDAHGRDARDRLRHESTVLGVLGAAGLPCPRPIDLVAIDDDLVLVMTALPGRDLATLLTDEHRAGHQLDGSTVRAIGAQLAEAMAIAHDAGVVLRDVSPGNLVVDLGEPGSASGGGRRIAVGLVDLEIAAFTGDDTPPFPRATLGAASPAQLLGDLPPSPSDDVFSLGTALWTLATGRTAGAEPGLDSLDRDRLCAARADQDEAVAALTLRCLDRDPRRRPDAATVARTLRSPILGGPPHTARRERPSRRWREAAARGRRRLVDEAPREADGATPDLASGLAGLCLAASTVAELTGDPAARAAARASAERLRSVDERRWPPGGLFVGRAGVAVALVHPVVRSAANGRRALELLAGIAPDDLPTADLFNGLAGVVRAHLLVGAALDERWPTDRAVELAAPLATEALTLPPDRRWRLPEGFGDRSGQACLGYAHGAAGIADVCADLFDATGDGKWIVVAAAALVPLLADPDADVLDGPPAPPVWCRGAGGAISALARTGNLDHADDALVRVRSHRTAGPSCCHGLAGQIELLVDAGCADDADPLATLLAPYLLPSGPSEPGGWLPAGLLEGNAGATVALTRLEHPGRRPWARGLFATGPPPAPEAGSG